MSNKATAMNKISRIQYEVIFNDSVNEIIIIKADETKYAPAHIKFIRYCDETYIYECLKE